MKRLLSLGIVFLFVGMTAVTLRGQDRFQFRFDCSQQFGESASRSKLTPNTSNSKTAAGVLRAWVKKYGVPVALYTDWKNVYVREASRKEQMQGVSLPAQNVSLS
jgi:hypothetical protein